MSKHLERLAHDMWKRLSFVEQDRLALRDSYSHANRDREALYEALGVAESGSPQVAALSRVASAKEALDNENALWEALDVCRSSSPQEDALAEIARLQSAATPVQGVSDTSAALQSAREDLSELWRALGQEDGEPEDCQQAALARIALLGQRFSRLRDISRQATFREVAGVLRKHLHPAPDLEVRNGGTAIPTLGERLRAIGWGGEFPDETTHVGVDLATGVTVLCHEDAEGRVRVEPVAAPAAEQPLPWPEWEQACEDVTSTWSGVRTKAVPISAARNAWVCSTGDSIPHRHGWAYVAHRQAMAGLLVWNGPATSLRDAVRKAVAACPELAPEPAPTHATDCRDTFCGGCREIPDPDAYDIGGAWEQALAEAFTAGTGAVTVECGGEMLLWNPASWRRFLRDVSGWCIQDEHGLADTPREAVAAMLKEEATDAD